MDDRQVRAGLDEQVDTGHPEVRDAVADELDDVVRADEEDVEIEVLDPGDEAPIVLLEDEPRIVEEGEGRLDQSALVRDREPEAVPHRSVPDG